MKHTAGRALYTWSPELPVVERVEGFDPQLKLAAAITANGRVLQHRRILVDVPGCPRPSDGQRLHPVVVGLQAAKTLRAVAGLSR